MKTGRVIGISIGAGCIFSFIRMCLARWLFSGAYFAEDVGIIEIFILYAILFSALVLVITFSWKRFVSKKSDKVHLIPLEKTGLILQMASIVSIPMNIIIPMLGVIFHFIMISIFLIGVTLLIKSKKELSISFLSWVIGFYAISIILMM